MYQAILVFFALSLVAAAQQLSKAEISKEPVDSDIRKSFKKADEFMNAGHYDSAQLSLNKIYRTLAYQKPSLFSYFLASRQTEIFYYNNLPQLGLNEAFKAERIASILKDSLLIADACNFIGLFHMSSNEFKPAIKNLKKAINYSRQPPYARRYMELSMPHHIYGNLAEAYEKFNMPDSAIYYGHKSLENANQIKSSNGITTALINLGSAFLSKNAIDSAINYFNLSNNYAVLSKRYDAQLNALGGLATCAMLKSDRQSALGYVKRGFKILEKHPQLNDFYTSLFLDAAIKVYKNYDKQYLLSKTLEQKSDRQTAGFRRYNLQTETLLLTSLQNEKRIFSLELAEARGKQVLATTKLYIVLLIFLLVVIVFITYRYYLKQKLRLANLRNKISRDLHDEVGATLSGIAIYSYITKEQVKNRQEEKIIQSLDIINDHSSEMVAKLGDIVWAVNPSEDTLYALLLRLKEFTQQLAALKNIVLEFEVEKALQSLKLSMEQRKNMYLICKEAINNAVKYSDCKLLRLEVITRKKEITITISDNGKGFNIAEINRGNGLINMEGRAKELKASISINSLEGSGTCIVFKLKIT